MNKENKILIDWLSFTSKVHSLDSIMNILGLVGCKFTLTYGMQGYQDRMTFDGINIHYNSHRNEGVWVELSGKGCRTFETFSDTDFHCIFALIKENPDEFHITRLDVAYDDFNDIIPIDIFSRDILKKNYLSRFKDKSMTVTCAAGRVGFTIDCGSRKSDIKFRCYDKAYERGYVPGDEDFFHWIRFEIQLRDDRAFSFISKLEPDNVGELFTGVVLNYIRVVKPSKTESNKSRWLTKKWYSDFIGNSEKISLFTKCDQEYNLYKCEQYVYRQCGNALDALITIKGSDVVLNELKERKPERSVKYTQLINDNISI